MNQLLKTWKLEKEQQENEHKDLNWHNGDIRPNKEGPYIIIKQDNAGITQCLFESFYDSQWNGDYYPYTSNDPLEDMIVAWSVIPGYWHFINQPERLSEKTSKEDAIV